MGKTYKVSELGDMRIYQNEKGDTKDNMGLTMFEVAKVRKKDVEKK